MPWWTAGRRGDAGPPQRSTAALRAELGARVTSIPCDVTDLGSSKRASLERQRRWAAWTASSPSPAVAWSELSPAANPRCGENSGPELDRSIRHRSLAAPYSLPPKADAMSFSSAPPARSPLGVCRCLRRIQTRTSRRVRHLAPRTRDRGDQRQLGDAGHIDTEGLIAATAINGEVNAGAMPAFASAAHHTTEAERGSRHHCIHVEPAQRRRHQRNRATPHRTAEPVRQSGNRRRHRAQAPAAVPVRADCLRCHGA